ncbi:MAG: type II secretion system ATPase GspE [Gammaproteobacteria bacterium]|nr:type II secretion system ATPase GspE [Gammaproteobacteria bacterium]
MQLVDPECVATLPYPFAKRSGVLVAYKEDGKFHVLCAESPAMGVLTELRRKLGAGFVFHQVDKAYFEKTLRQAYDKGQSEATQMVDDLGDEVDLELLAQELPQTTDLLEASNDAPIVRLINALLTQAIRESASDIHLEAFEQRSVVRIRVDGVLRDVVEPQRALHGALVSRLKVMAKLDIAEKRLPQDGRISLRVGEHPIDVRVSTLPTQHGERVVLRLLDKQASRLKLEELGMDAALAQTFDRLVHNPHGIVLVTGPTGSGKTTTLYAGLIRLDRQELNILTVEDPIEYDLDGVGQTQVHSKIGLTFAGGLRSILRQDPDVVLVGEIRDLETAEIAVQASLTGHMVLSTLHTNTAIGAVTRLVDMGVEAFLISSSLIGVLAQRLVRKLCPQCKQDVVPEGRQRELLRLGNGEDVQIYKPGGCEQCEYSGYRGRTGIYELILIDDTLRTMIHDGAAEDQMLSRARQQSKSLADNGFEKVLAGVTSIDEVLRVTRDE